jgi:hypothetical protein
MTQWANGIAILTGLLAAGFWLWSARVSVPDLLDTTIGGEGSITDILKRQSRLSAVAAIFAALSVMAQAATLFMKPN